MFSSPDYVGAANAQAQASAAATKSQTSANRPDIATPWGSVSWSNPGGGDKWAMSLNLSPDQQRSLDSQFQLQRERSGLAEQLMPQAREELSGPLDFSGLPQVPGAGDLASARQRAVEGVYGSATALLDPQWQRQEQQVDAQLQAQGLRPGTEAYDNAKKDFGNQRATAYGTAMSTAQQMGTQTEAQAFQQGLTGRQQALSEMLQKRGWTINEIQSLLGGEQVNQPSMPGFNPAGVAQTPQILAATQMSGNAQAGGLQSIMGGIDGLAGMFSL